MDEVAKKVFISYSWTTPKHEMWVIDLAKRLVASGIDVILDKWDLQEGQDKYAFMEKMVQDESIDKVLVICDRGYKDKADNRAGGVGTETQIITPALYGKVEQTKFIPIIAETGEQEFDEFMPHYLKSRIGIVMTPAEAYIDGFEKLLRVIYEQPMFQKPKLGKKPPFLEERARISSRLQFINQQLKKYIDDDKQTMIEFKIQEFKEVYFEELDEFIVEDKDFVQPYDEQINTLIDELLPLRNEWITFFENLLGGYTNFDEDIILEFFEQLYSYSEYKRQGSYAVCITEHYKFLITELFIWTNALLIKNKKYKEMHNILYTRYFVKSKSTAGDKPFGVFRFYLQMLESRKNRLNLRRIGITADKLVERSIHNGRNYKELLLDADLILYYVGKTIEPNNWETEWFPTTYIYKKEYEKIDILQKMKRKKHFDDIKCIFNVNSKEEMKSLIETKLSGGERGYSGDFGIIPLIRTSIQVDEIAMY